MVGQGIVLPHSQLIERRRIHQLPTMPSNALGINSTARWDGPAPCISLGHDEPGPTQFLSSENQAPPPSSKSQGCNDPCWGDDWQIAEHDVADYLAVHLSDQGYTSKTTGTQGIDQPSLGFLPECKRFTCRTASWSWSFSRRMSIGMATNASPALTRIG